MRAFVTGGTGFLGLHLIRELLAQGYAVTALVRTFERARQLPHGVRAIPADVTKPESFRHALRGVDVVFHAAAVTKVGVRPGDYERIRRINVDGARLVLAQAVEAGVPRIVHVSSVAVYGNTRGQAVDETSTTNGSPFESETQRTKHQAHFEVAVPLQKAGVPVIVACLGALYGPGDTSPLRGWLRQHARGRLPVMLGPDNARSWTYAADAARGLRLAAEAGRPGETYHLAGPVHTFREFFAACARASGMPAPLVWLPSNLATFLAGLTGRLLPATAERLRTLAGVTYLARADKAATELGWQARPLAEGLPPTFEWLREDE
jgi:dihydroflavonol-4-reductase